jgi:hypothetical protein
MTISFTSVVAVSSATGPIDGDGAVRAWRTARFGVSAGADEPAVLSQVACAF